jgi:uncharacterized protein
MLEMRSQCERCGAPLAQNAEHTWICSFECTFCTECAERALRGTCPNCQGARLGSLGRLCFQYSLNPTRNRNSGTRT